MNAGRFLCIVFIEVSELQAWHSVHASLCTGLNKAWPFPLLFYSKPTVIGYAYLYISATHPSGNNSLKDYEGHHRLKVAVDTGTLPMGYGDADFPLRVINCSWPLHRGWRKDVYSTSSTACSFLNSTFNPSVVAIKNSASSNLELKRLCKLGEICMWKIWESAGVGLLYSTANSQLEVEHSASIPRTSSSNRLLLK